MNNNKKTILSYSQRLLLLTAMLFAVSGVAFAQTQSWTPPPQDPPEGNVPAPINVGTSHQQKLGGIAVGGFSNRSSRTNFAGTSGLFHWLTFGTFDTSGSTIFETWLDRNNRVIGVRMNSDGEPIFLGIQKRIRFTRLDPGSTAFVAGTQNLGSLFFDRLSSGEVVTHFNNNSESLWSGPGTPFFTDVGYSRISLSSGLASEDSGKIDLAVAPKVAGSGSSMINWFTIMRLNIEGVRIFRNLRVDGDTNLFGELNICTAPGSCQNITEMIGEGGGSLWSQISGTNNIFRGQGNNVGIGGHPPQINRMQRLHVMNGNMAFERSDRPENGRLLYFMNTGIGDSYGYKFSWRNDNGGQRIDPLIMDVDGSVYFRGPRVGVGLNDPQERLHVNGNIRASGDICTDLGGGRCLSTISGGGDGLDPNDISKWQTIFQFFSDGQVVPFLLPKSGNVVVSIPTILRLNNSALLEQTGSTRVLTVNSSGSVGYRNLSDIGEGGDSLWSQGTGHDGRNISYNPGGPDDRFTVAIGWSGNADSPYTLSVARQMAAGGYHAAHPANPMNSPSTPTFGFASSPTISGAGLGMYAPAANTLSFATAGLHRLSISPNGALCLGQFDGFNCDSRAAGGIYVRRTGSNPAWLRLEGGGSNNHSGLTLGGVGTDTYWSFAFRGENFSGNPNGLVLGYGDITSPTSFVPRFFVTQDKGVGVSDVFYAGVNEGWSQANLLQFDWNGDGVVNAVDVQLAINCALGLTPTPTPAGCSSFNAQQVQQTINAALGIPMSGTVLTPENPEYTGPYRIISAGGIGAGGSIVSAGDVCAFGNVCLSNILSGGGSGGSLWSLSGTDISRMNGRVGIGTNTFGSTDRLRVNGSLRIDQNSDNASRILFTNRSNNASLAISNFGDFAASGGPITTNDALIRTSSGGDRTLRVTNTGGGNFNLRVDGQVRANEFCDVNGQNCIGSNGGSGGGPTGINIPAWTREGAIVGSSYFWGGGDGTIATAEASWGLGASGSCVLSVVNGNPRLTLTAQGLGLGPYTQTYNNTSHVVINVPTGISQLDGTYRCWVEVFGQTGTSRQWEDFARTTGTSRTINFRLRFERNSTSGTQVLP